MLFCTYHRLVYDDKTDRYYDSPNVDVIAPGVGNVTLLEYLSTYEEVQIEPYFKDFTDFFTSKYSYVRGNNLRGAPYDWRLAPSTYTHSRSLY